MTKLHTKFVSNIKKLEDYLLLKEEEEYLILGTLFPFKQLKEMNGNIFQPYTATIETNVYVCFILNICDGRVDLYKYSQLPMLWVNSKVRLYSVNNLKKYFDDFLSETYK